MGLTPYRPSSEQKLIIDDFTRCQVGHFARTALENCAADTDGILDGGALIATAKTFTTFLAQPSCAKNITVAGMAVNMAGTVTVNGTNIYGEAISEDFALSGTDSIVGSKAFKTVTSVVAPALTTAGDTIDVGWGVKLGLPCCLAYNTILKALRDTGTSDSGTLAVSAAAVESNTYIAGAQAKILDLWIAIN